MRMAAEHRANFEQTLKGVVNAASAAVRAMKRSSTVQGVTDAEECWQSYFRDSVEMLDDHIWRQSMEADSLAQQQTMECQGKTAPRLEISFPFYNSFDDCIQAVEKVVKSSR